METGSSRASSAQSIVLPLVKLFFIGESLGGFVELPFFMLVCYDMSMTLLDGKKIAERMLAELKEEIAAMKENLRLAVVVVGQDPVIDNFIAQKKKAGESVGVDVRVYPFPADITTNELRRRIAEIVHEKKNTGVIIQLPLPAHINRQYILNAIPPEKDPDVLSSRAVGNFAVGKSPVMPPVVGAIKILFQEYGIEYQGRKIVVLGAGALVGRPVALWLAGEHATFTLVGSEKHDPKEFLADADIVIAGIGKQKFVTARMIKKGVVLIDAGTSESEGRIAGDIDADSVGDRASHLAPVPGGVGPLTVAVLFKNLVTLSKL